MSSYTAHEKIKAERRRLKAQYGVLYDEVIEMLARHDPIHLTRNGAPDDEYEGEARAILTRLKEAQSISEVRDLIHEVFVQSFNYGYGADQDPDKDDPKCTDDLAGAASNYDEVAREVWAVWQRYLAFRGKSPQKYG